MRPSGTYSSDTAREISEKIDALVEQSSQGQFTPEGRQDILAAAIGRPEHPGRVRAAGPGVGITDYFGSSSRQPSYSYSDTQRMTEEITKKVRQDLIQEIRAEVRAEFQMLYQEQFQSMRPVQSPIEEHTQQKIPLSEDDPLSSLHLLADILDDKPLEVEYDANVFGHGSEVPIYLNSQDVRELASGTQELNISIIQLWTMYMSGVTNKLGRSDDYGFIDPQSIHESNDFEHINMSLISSFRRGKKIYFLPYISGRHWQLLVMSMQDNYALWFCSLHRPPPPQLKQAIDW
ncbi:uncharacterized protein LOC128193682 [Vigna angularis]|uniref:uncharacterized protein LOC128193682 n=1 Tax=Phaseolus angularis TaxID=3914 RepID=UPI0022B38499|nr:uncharacterized protein LOC128193682 [Vigna angularis]